MILDLIEELKKYDKNICTMYPGINQKKIDALENAIGYNLPLDFKEFLTHCNGFELLSDRVYGVHDGKKAIDLLENYKWEKEESNNPLWAHLLPFAPDGSGSHFCLDLKTVHEKTCKVVYWQYDYSYSKKDPPDINNYSFSDYLKDILEDIHETINYNGTDK